MLATAVAQERESEPSPDILIRNATLVDPAGGTPDRLVSVIIRAGELEILTEDAVSGEDFDEVIDASAGIIIGNLEIGEPPNFMILSADPREDFDVLLDTQTYASFAMYQGEVVRNYLRSVEEPEVDEEEEPQRSGWLAYTPPPLAVPLNYTDTTRWNRFETSPISGIFAAGLVLDRVSWLSQDAASEVQVGDLAEFEGGEIRGFRLGFVGTLNTFDKPWVYTVFGATHAFDKGFDVDESDSFSFFDWRVDIPIFSNSALSVGKQKEPISGEKVQSMIYNHMQERSAVADALLPSRNVGVVWSGNSPENYVSWAAGIFNDWFDADQDLDESATQYIGRLTWAPLRTDDDSSLLHLGAGFRYSNGREGFRSASEPEIDQAPAFVDTGFSTPGTLPADRIRTYNAEISWRRGPMWLASEITRTDVTSPTIEDPSFEGYWLAASWALTGEMRPYDVRNGTFGGVPIARSVDQDGKGAIELSARWSSVDLTNGLIEGGEMDIASLGVTWWLTPVFSVSANYREIRNARLGLQGRTSGFNTRVVLILE